MGFYEAEEVVCEGLEEGLQDAGGGGGDGGVEGVGEGVEFVAAEVEECCVRGDAGEEVGEKGCEEGGYGGGVQEEFA